MKVIFRNQEVEAEEVDFETVKEDWNEYRLKDGTTLKIKLVLGRALRTEAYDEGTGAPHYVVQTTNIVRVMVPEKLKKSEKITRPIAVV